MLLYDDQDIVLRRATEIDSDNFLYFFFDSLKIILGGVAYNNSSPAIACMTLSESNVSVH